MRMMVIDASVHLHTLTTQLSLKHTQLFTTSEYFSEKIYWLDIVLMYTVSIRVNLETCPSFSADKLHRCYRGEILIHMPYLGLKILFTVSNFMLSRLP